MMDDQLDETQDNMVQAIYEHTIAVVTNELVEYTEWLMSQGVMRHRGPLEFDGKTKVEQYIREKWSDET